MYDNFSFGDECNVVNFLLTQNIFLDWKTLVQKLLFLNKFQSSLEIEDSEDENNVETNLCLSTRVTNIQNAFQ